MVDTTKYVQGDLALKFDTAKSATLKEFQRRITQQFNASAEIFRNDMNRLYTHFISLEELVEEGGNLTNSLEVLLKTTEKIVETVGNRTPGIKEIAGGEGRGVVVEGGQKRGKGILNAFDKVKRETKKLFRKGECII